MTTAPVAIPQTYKGVRFRSTLEANWARTLDAWTIAWSYEPEAFSLPSGASYLPDFHLPEINTWLEVKGPGVGGIGKFYEFTAARTASGDGPRQPWPGRRELFAVGSPPSGSTPIFIVTHRACNRPPAAARLGECPACQRINLGNPTCDKCPWACMNERCGAELDRVDLPFVIRQWQPKRKAGAHR